MSGLQRFSRGAQQAPQQAGGGRFGGGGAAPRAATPAARGGRFGGQQQAPEPEPEQEPEEQAPPARGGRFGGGGQQAPQQAQGSRFGRGAPQAQGGRPQGRPQPQRSVSRAPGGRFTGLRSEVPQTPPLTEGSHEVEILISEERQSQKNGGGDHFCHVDVMVVDSDSLTPEDVRHLMFATTGNGAKRGQGRLMALVRGLFGYWDDDSFIADLPEYNVLIGAVCGERDCEDAINPSTGQPWGENPLKGLRVICHATLGQLRDNGDGTSTQFYNYVWEPLPEEG